MRKSTTGVLAVVALGLLAFILLHERFMLSSTEVGERRGRVLERLVRDKITRAEIQRGNAKLVIEKEARSPGSSELDPDRWRLVGPPVHPADDDAVLALLGAFEWLEPRRTIHGASAQDLRTFGLERPRVVVRFVVGRETMSLSFGAEAPSGEGVYARGDEPSIVYVVGKDTFEAVDHDATHFRSKALFPGASVANARSFQLEGAGSVARDTLTRQGDGSWRVTAPLVGRASTNAIEAWLGAVDGLRAQSFVADDVRGAALAAYGLASPAFKARVETFEASVIGQDAGAPRPRTLGFSVGGACEQATRRHVLIEGEGTVLCVDAAALTPVMLRADDLWEKRLSTLGPDDLRRVDVARGAERISIVRKEPGGGADGAGQTEWSFGAGAAARAADTDTVRAMLEPFRAPMSGDSAVVATLGETTLRASLELFDSAATTPRERIELRTASTGELFALRVGDALAWKVGEDLFEVVDPAPIRFRALALLHEPDDALRRVAITRAGEEGAEEVAVAREGRWTLSSMGDLPADRALLVEIERRFGLLRAVRWVADRAAPAHGLSAPRAIVRARFEGPLGEDANAAPREHILRLGADAAAGAYATLDDDPAVFVAPRALLDAVLSPLVQKEAVALAVADGAQLRVEARGAAERILQRRGDTLVDAEGRVVANAARARALFEALGALRASSVRRGAAPTTWRMALSAQSPNVRIEIGERAGEGADARYVVRREGVPLLFMVPAESVDVVLESLP